MGIAQTTNLQPVVDQFYPDDRLKPRDAAERHSCYAVLAATATDEPTIILAAYTDRTTGAIRVLRRAGPVFEVAQDNPDAWMLNGTRCQIRLRDLDFDGRPEAFVSFLGVRASSGWLFKWDGSTLVNMTPVQPVGDRVSSLLLSPTVYDLEQSGPLRVVAERVVDRPGPGVRPRLPAYVYRPGVSGLDVEKTILAVMGFRADVDPRGNVRAFKLVQDSQPPYTLRVVNGDRTGRNRVTSATISINDVPVIGPAHVNERTGFATVSVELTTDNHVTAMLTGPPDASIIVLVEDSTKR
jgi:hypothetical protein